LKVIPNYADNSGTWSEELAHHIEKKKRRKREIFNEKNKAKSAGLRSMQKTRF
jgi:hypothetical protein